MSKRKYHDYDGQCKEHPTEQKAYDGICWSCYMENLMTEDLDSFFDKIGKEYGDADIQPTYFIQGAQRWNKRRKFESDLKEKGIGWFAYIKFYIQEGKSRPLAVGKTGARHIKNSNADISFSEYTENGKDDGPARRFLYVNGYSWDETRILIIPAICEKNALDIERYIACKFGLLES